MPRAGADSRHARGRRAVPRRSRCSNSASHRRRRRALGLAHLPAACYRRPRSVINTNGIGLSQVARGVAAAHATAGPSATQQPSSATLATPAKRRAAICEPLIEILENITSQRISSGVWVVDAGLHALGALLVDLASERLHQRLEHHQHLQVAAAGRARHAKRSSVPVDVRALRAGPIRARHGTRVDWPSIDEAFAVAHAAANVAACARAHRAMPSPTPASVPRQAEPALDRFEHAAGP